MAFSCELFFFELQKRSQKIYLTIIIHLFWDCQAHVLRSSGIFLGIVIKISWDLFFWSFRPALCQIWTFLTKTKNKQKIQFFELLIYEIDMARATKNLKIASNSCYIQQQTWCSRGCSTTTSAAHTILFRQKLQ